MRHALPSIPPADARPLRILVVEDDADAPATTLAAVQALGQWATGVTSAESAMTRYLPGAFDLLLLTPALLLRPMSALSGCAWLHKPFTLDEFDGVLSVVPLQPIRDAA